MQHETSYPASLGFDEFDVSNSYCEYVVEHADSWLRRAPAEPFLLTAGFFETHRPYPQDRYEPADRHRGRAARLSARHPGGPPGPRRFLRVDHGGRRRRWADCWTRSAETGLDRSTWVVFMTDHGPALPRAKSTLYDAGTGIAMIVRSTAGGCVPPRRYDELFSGVDLLPTLLDLLGVEIPAEVAGPVTRRATCSAAARDGCTGAHRGVHD